MLASALQRVAARGGTYTLRHPETGEVCRTGRTGNQNSRRGQHRRNPLTKNLRYVPEEWTDSYEEQRGLEQLLFDDNPGAELDKIRPISLNNARIGEYLKAAADFLARTRP